MGNTKLLKGLNLVIGLTLLGSYTIALAETEPTTAATSVAEESTLKDKITISYLNWLHGGPALTGLFESRQHDQYGNVLNDTRVVMRHYIAPAYKLTPDTTLGVTFSFDHHYLGGQDATFMDPYVRLFNKSLIKSGGFSLAADARGYMGVSSPSRKKDLLGGFRSTQYTNYDIPNTSITVGINTYAWFFVNGNTAKINATDIEVYAGPNVNYKLSETVTAGILYEMAADHARDVSYGDWFAAGTDLEPNVSWDITPNINFNPYLNFTTGGKINADSTSLGWLLTVKFL